MAVAWRFAEIWAQGKEIAYNYTEIVCKAFSLVKHRFTPEMSYTSHESSNCSMEIGYKCTEISIASFYTCNLLPYLNII